MELLQMSKHTGHILICTCTPMELFGLDPFLYLMLTLVENCSMMSSHSVLYQTVTSMQLSLALPHIVKYLLKRITYTELDSDINRALYVLTERITTDTKRKSYKDLWNSLKKYSIFSIRSLFKV